MVLPIGGRAREEDASVSASLERVIDVLERVVTNQARLLRLETRAAASRAGRSAGWFAVAGALGLLAWCALCAVLVLLLGRTLPLWTSLCAVAVLNGAIAALAARVGVQRLRVPDEVEEDLP